MSERPTRAGWLRPYLSGVLSAMLVAGTVLLLSRPRLEATEILIATPTSGSLMVAISGEISQPGLYALPVGSRVADLIERAGGVTARADPATPSRALLLRDELQIYIPARPEPVTPAAGLGVAASTPASATPTPTPGAAAAPAAVTVDVMATSPPGPPPTLTGGAASTATRPASGLTPSPPTRPPPSPSPGRPPPLPSITSGGLVNLNSASAVELERLPGVGPALAARIIAERERNGPFRRIEELERVPGIGPLTLARLRPLVTV